MNLKTLTLGGLLGILALSISGCGMKDLHSTSLKIGVVGKTYLDSFLIEEEGWDWDSDGTVLSVTSGSLPPGLYLTSSGQIVGTPTAVGAYTFRITAYTFDDSWDDDDDVDSDSETYTLFVTEDSTNADCPSSDDETTQETYVCLGEIEEDSIAEESTVTLDVNYFTSFTHNGTYDIRVVDFTINYDATVFEPTESLLNSQILREAATWWDGSVEFTQVDAGELRVIVTAGSGAFYRSGRLMDLSFTAIRDVPAGEYPFTVTINQVLNGDGAAADTDLAPIDGLITVTTGPEEDESH